MLTAIGKKLTKAITITFEPIPKPLQTTTSAAIAGTGTSWEITSHG